MCGRHPAVLVCVCVHLPSYACTSLIGVFLIQWYYLTWVKWYYEILFNQLNITEGRLLNRHNTASSSHFFVVDLICSLSGSIYLPIRHDTPASTRIVQALFLLKFHKWILMPNAANRGHDFYISPHQCSYKVRL